MLVSDLRKKEQEKHACINSLLSDFEYGRNVLELLQVPAAEPSPQGWSLHRNHEMRLLFRYFITGVGNRWKTTGKRL